MAAAEKQPVTITCAGPLNGVASTVITWVDQRFPLMSSWRDHLAEYYAPKNFNFWYYFGSLALLVLVNQIVTGLFLTMHYKPSAAEAFGCTPAETGLRSAESAAVAEASIRHADPDWIHWREGRQGSWRPVSKLDKSMD